MFDGVEVGDAPEHHDGTRLTVITGPASQAGKDPGGECKGSFRVGIFLLGGFALETLGDAFKGWLVVWIEGVGERTFGFSVAFGDQLHDGDGGNETGDDKFFQRTIAHRRCR